MACTPAVMQRARAQMIVTPPHKDMNDNKLNHSLVQQTKSVQQETRKLPGKFMATRVIVQTTRGFVLVPPPHEGIQENNMHITFFLTRGTPRSAQKKKPHNAQAPNEPPPSVPKQLGITYILPNKARPWHRPLPTPWFLFASSSRLSSSMGSKPFASAAALAFHFSLAAASLASCKCSL